MRPFNRAKYEAHLKGLDITELSLSAVQQGNEKIRIDSEYFAHEPMRVANAVKALPVGTITLGAATSVLKKGIFDINANSYTESGVPFVRITNLRSGLISAGDIVFIDEATHEMERKTALLRGDLILSKTAYPAASYVNLDRCNVSQDTIAVKLRDDLEPPLHSAYVAAYLNGHHGLLLMRREFQGNVQMHLSLDDASKMRIPLFGRALQEKVCAKYEAAINQLAQAEAYCHKADRLLLDAVALTTWVPPEPLTYTHKFKEVFADSRLDAEHFQPKYRAMLEHVRKHARLCRIVDEFAVHCDRGEQPEYVQDGALAVINSQHILEAGLDYEGFERTDENNWNNPEYLSARIQENDVLTYMTGANVGRTAAFLSKARALASNEVNILRIREEDPIYISAVMNSMIGRWQTRMMVTGSAQVHLYPQDIRHYVIPFVDKKTEQKIVQATQDSNGARRKAFVLLDDAKRAVEIAIEDSESAALKFLGKIEKETSP